MKEKGKKVLYAFVLLLLAGAFIYMMLVEPIMSLVNKKDLKTLNVSEAGEILSLEHSINGLIPTGKEYYYIGIENGTQNAYIIRASKKWLEQNFGSDYKALDSNGFTFTSLSLWVKDFEVREELAKRCSQIEGLNFPNGTDYYYEFSYKTIAIKKILMFVYALLLAVVGLYFKKNSENIAGLVRKVYLVFFIVFLVLVLRIIN